MRALLAYYDAVMSAAAAAAARGAGCARECSGRGDCLNGTCLCEIRYAGEECAGPNMPYHACIGGVFLLVSFVCAVQLTVCILSEYRRLKAPSIAGAFKVTTQKALYMVAFLASLIRGAYFISPSAFQEGWATGLLSAYYPLLMSASSLIVCFWAEVFHLRDIRWERPRFLSKSFLAFVTFNLIIYSLLAAEVLTTAVADTTAENKTLYQHVFNGCYAFLMLVVVTFFLIYGVEVYFKVRGEFLKESPACSAGPGGRGRTAAGEGEGEDEASHTLVDKQSTPRAVDTSQLHQSRLGLVSQALMLLIIVALLASETFADFWKNKVPVVSRNWHDIVFRLAEIGVCLWFPCVLWNCMAPERLWILNPRRLLARQLDDRKLQRLLNHTAAHKPYAEASEGGPEETEAGGRRECWICYEGVSIEPLIRPCRCSGDVATVHHTCLRTWLIESAATVDGLKCKVCNTPYVVEQTNKVQWEVGFTCAHWTRLALGVSAVCGAGAAAGGVVRLCAAPVPRVLAASAALLVCYVALRFLGTNTVAAYQRAKVSSLKILAESEVSPPTDQLSTISRSVTVDIASKAVLEQALKGDIR